MEAELGWRGQGLSVACPRYVHVIRGIGLFIESFSTLFDEHCSLGFVVRVSPPPPSLGLSLSLSVSVSLCVSLSVCLSVSISVCLSVYLCLSVSVSVSLSL